MFFQLSTALTLLHVLLTLGVSVRVIMRRPPTGVAAAWLMLVAFLPYVGIVFYLLVGNGGSECAALGESPSCARPMPTCPAM
jgi:hypothetical protein